MKRNTPERQKYNKEAREARDQYLKDFPFCFCCQKKYGLAVHEIACGSARKAALKEPCAWMTMCSSCNTDLMTDYNKWPIARQLALKFIHDPDNYDRRKVNELRGRAPESITPLDVMFWYTYNLGWLDVPMDEDIDLTLGRLV